MKRLSAAGLALCVGLSGGCGGGGGGGSEPTVPYTGVTAEARVTAGSAEDLAALALGGMDLGAIGGIAFRGGDPVEAGRTQVFRAAWRVRDVALETWQGRAERRAQRPVREAWSDPGPCGGSAAFDITADDQTGVFNGSLSFQEYRECDGSVLRGGTRFSGQIDLVVGEPLYMTLSFGTLAYEDAQDHFAMGGSLFFDFRGGPTEIFEMTVNVRDEVEGLTYRFEGYRTETTLAGDGANVAITAGRCYHPTNGYVEVRSLQPLHISFGQDFPASGVVRANGSNGTWLVLTALSAEQCRVQADTDGNGVEDWDSGAIPWTDL